MLMIGSCTIILNRIKRKDKFFLWIGKRICLTNTEDGIGNKSDGGVESRLTFFAKLITPLLLLL
jgi:hypothetical protein